MKKLLATFLLTLLWQSTSVAAGDATTPEIASKKKTASRKVNSKKKAMPNGATTNAPNQVPTALNSQPGLEATAGVPNENPLSQNELKATNQNSQKESKVTDETVSPIEIPSSSPPQQQEAQKEASTLAPPQVPLPDATSAPLLSSEKAISSPATKILPPSPLPNGELPLEGEVAIILNNNRFYPARFKLKEGQPIHLYFTSLNPKPAALIIEELQIQRWIAKESPQRPTNSPLEISRELDTNRMVEITLQPKRGTYQFHDALSGAMGEIFVE